MARIWAADFLVREDADRSRFRLARPVLADLLQADHPLTVVPRLTREAQAADHPLVDPVAAPEAQADMRRLSR